MDRGRLKARGERRINRLNRWRGRMLVWNWTQWLSLSQVSCEEIVVRGTFGVVGSMPCDLFSNPTLADETPGDVMHERLSG
jgi:hypothetical protein